jgi:thioester reductase-like protein
MRILDLAKECKKLLTLTHVSTAYVNSIRKGFIEEKIYPLDNNGDPEERIQEILRMNPQYIADNEKTLIGNYPNTYTWSKSMAERALLKKHGQLRISLIRPTIVICSYEEPTPGWTDTLAAGGGIIFAATSGLLHVVYANPALCLDMVPVDYVSNYVICSSVYTAKLEKPQVVVCHSSSSQLNPVYI